MSDILTRLLLNTSDYDSKLKKAKGSTEEFASAIFHILDELGYQNEVLEKARRQYSDVIINNNKEEVGYRKAVFTL